MAKIYNNYSFEHPNEPVAQVSTPVLKNRFLELYMLTGHVQKTCKILGLVPRTFYHWKYHDPQFKTDLEMADRVALSLLEDEATRRAMYGVQRPVYQGKSLVGYTTEYSDQLLIVLLKARAPDKYRETWKGELTGADGKPLVSDMKIIHVHSNLELAQSEDQVQLDNTIRIEAEVVSSKVNETTVEDELLNEDDLL